MAAKLDEERSCMLWRRLRRTDAVVPSGAGGRLRRLGGQARRDENVDAERVTNARRPSRPTTATARGHTVTYADLCPASPLTTIARAIGQVAAAWGVANK
jgi:hypothetical protein